MGHKVARSTADFARGKRIGGWKSPTAGRPSPLLLPPLSDVRGVNVQGDTFQVDATGVGRNLRAIDGTTRRKSNRSCVSQPHLRPACASPLLPSRTQPSLSSIVSSPTLSTNPSSGQPPTELTSVPERHPFRLECERSRRFESTISTYSDPTYSCIAPLQRAATVN